MRTGGGRPCWGAWDLRTENLFKFFKGGTKLTNQQKTRGHPNSKTVKTKRKIELGGGGYMYRGGGGRAVTNY